MRKFFTYSFAIWLTLFYGCSNEQGQLETADLTLQLRWIPSHDNETLDDALTGLTWAFSFLGANLPIEYAKESIVQQSNSIVLVNFNKLGFSQHALSAFHYLVSILQSSEEYQMNESIAMGRFIALTINSSNHYYKITGVFPTRNDFDNAYTYQDLKAAIVPSAISKGDRLIHIGTLDNDETMAFKAEEGTGDIAFGTYESKEFEVIDMMKNGQLRFAIYNEQGILVSNSDSTLSISGKPAKCLWCHETHLLPSFEASDTISGYMNGTEFANLIEGRMTTLEHYRSQLSSSFSYADEADHELMEIMYISFMEPSAEVLSKEWNMSVAAIKNILANLPTHEHHEFPFLGELYYRSAVRNYAPFQAIQAPGDARESSAYEPDLIP